MKAESRFRGIATLSLTSALEGAGGHCHTHSADPEIETQYSLYMRLGGKRIKFLVKYCL
jgi:hypothetical protein